MVVVKEELRKGPWSEQEDLQLVFYLGLFGDRRWDFIAKVSGLNRTGKSCRLRWVNYLHPGLRRSRMTPQEERLVIELHSRWGNRWSRIARRLPGRTDNEIKNYWRTHMRKRAQEQKRNSSQSPSSSSSSSSFYVNFRTSELTTEAMVEIRESSSDQGNSKLISGFEEELAGVKGYSMDEIWNEIDTSESLTGLGYEELKDEASDTNCNPEQFSVWDYCYDSLWGMNDED